jgi:hypothetical protein
LFKFHFSCFRNEKISMTIKLILLLFDDEDLSVNCDTIHNVTRFEKCALTINKIRNTAASVGNHQAPKVTVF